MNTPFVIGWNQIVQVFDSRLKYEKFEFFFYSTVKCWHAILVACEMCAFRSNFKSALALIHIIHLYFYSVK